MLTYADLPKNYESRPAIVRTAAEMRIGASKLESILRAGQVKPCVACYPTPCAACYPTYTIKFSEPIPVPDAKKLLDTNSLVLDGIIDLGNKEKSLYELVVREGGIDLCQDRVKQDINSLFVYGMEITDTKNPGSIPIALIENPNIVVFTYSKELQHDMQKLKEDLEKITTKEEREAWNQKRQEVDRRKMQEDYNGKKVARMLSKGKDYEKKGDLQSAIDTYRQVIERYPDQAIIAQYLIATNYLKMGNKQKALAEFQQVLKYSDDYSPANVLHSHVETIIEEILRQMVIEEMKKDEQK